MSRLEKLRSKWARRKRGRARQIRLWKRTGKRGHRKKAGEHGRAMKFLRRVIGKEEARANRPSPNFSYSEFDCHRGDKVPESAYPALDHLCQTYLEPLRKEFGPVHVTSGYRPSDYNASIGGASMSIHIYDYPGRNGGAVAADVWCSRGTPSQWAAFVDRLNPAGLGTYPRSGFIHVDNRDRIDWPRSRWSG